MFTTLDKQQKTLYLHPRKDGGYIWQAALTGAALWKTYEEALGFKELAGFGSEVRITRGEVPKDIQIVSRDELRNMEK